MAVFNDLCHIVTHPADLCNLSANFFSTTSACTVFCSTQGGLPLLPAEYSIQSSLRNSHETQAKFVSLQLNFRVDQVGTQSGLPLLSGEVAEGPVVRSKHGEWALGLEVLCQAGLPDVVSEVSQVQVLPSDHQVMNWLNQTQTFTKTVRLLKSILKYLC